MDDRWRVRVYREIETLFQEGIVAFVFQAFPSRSPTSAYRYAPLEI